MKKASGFRIVKVFGTLKLSVKILLIFIFFISQGKAFSFEKKEKVPSLFSLLCSLERNDSESALWEVHGKWIGKIISFVDENKDGKGVIYPEDSSHPIYYFDRKDAKEILKPIFKNISGVDLKGDLIEKIFLEKLPIYRDDYKKSKKSFFSKEYVKENTFEIAKKVYELVRGNILIVLGQTPAYLGVMVKEIQRIREESDCTKIFNIPFSGRPNYIRKIAYKGVWEEAFLDIVTSEGEKVFRDILKSEYGLHPKKIKEKIFILDNSTGPSIASFLAILKRWFDECGLKMPFISYLHMRDEDDLFVKNENGKWVKPKSDKKVDLVFYENLRFDIPVIFLGMRDDVLVAFDKVFDNLRIVPSFNGINWREGYFMEISKKYPCKEAKELILEYRAYVRKSLY